MRHGSDRRSVCDEWQTVSSKASGMSSAVRVLWVCPAPVALTTAAVAAALYAFSDLIDDQPDASPCVVREELRFLVGLHGTAAIELVADWLAMHGPAPLPQQLAAGVPTIGRPLAARLTWCREQAESLVDDETARQV
jgi:hypothetical protein